MPTIATRTCPSCTYRLETMATVESLRAENGKLAGRNRRLTAEALNHARELAALGDELDYWRSAAESRPVWREWLGFVLCLACFGAGFLMRVFLER